VSGRAQVARRRGDTIQTDQEVTTMQYLLMLRFPPGDGPQEGTPGFDDEMRRWGEIKDELKQAGALVGVSGLRLDATTTVRARDGELTVTDGPYAEAKEILFTFFIIDVPDLDAATEWASKMPAAHYGSIEIQPMVGLETA
jgi:hypothetical protein